MLRSSRLFEVSISGFNALDRRCNNEAKGLFFTVPFFRAGSYMRIVPFLFCCQCMEL